MNIIKTLLCAMLFSSASFAQTPAGYAIYQGYMSKNEPTQPVDTYAQFIAAYNVPGTLESTFVTGIVPIDGPTPTPLPTPVPSPTPIPIVYVPTPVPTQIPSPTPIPKINVVVASTAQLVNLSTLCYISNQYGWGTSGGVIENRENNNNSTFTLLIRASGPALAEFGVADYIIHPVLTVFHNGHVVATNTGWTNSNTTVAQFNDAFSKSGAFDYAADSTDSAILLTITVPVNTAYSFTCQVQGFNNETGKCLIECYQVVMP